MFTSTQNLLLSMIGGRLITIEETSASLRIESPSLDQPLTNIIILHGLNSSHEKTWTFSSGEIWLKKMALLVPRSRFMKFEYNSDISEVGLELISSLGVWSLAVQLLQALITDGDNLEEIFKRRYIFIAHGFGGIIVKQALCIANHHHKYMSIALGTLGLVFFGTPQKANTAASWERIIFDMIAHSHGENGITLMPLVSLRSPWMSLVDFTCWPDISEKFHFLVERYQIVNVFAKKKTSLLDLLSVNKEFPLSCGTSTDQGHWGRDYDYLSLCSFSGEDDKDFRRLAEELKGITQVQKDIDLNWYRCRQQLTAVYRKSCSSDNVPLQHNHAFHWISHNEKYLDWWKTDGDKILHLRGCAGQGKTTLCTFLSRKLREKNGTVVLSFFCNRSDSRRDSAKYILLSMVLHLLHLEPSLFTHIAETYQAISKISLWSKEDIWTLLRTMLSHPRAWSLVCLIDALDECGSDSSDWLLNRLAGLQRETDFPFSLVFSSRCPASELTDTIPPERFAVIDINECVEISGDIEDCIRSWVARAVRETPVFRGLEKYLTKKLESLNHQRISPLSANILLGILSQHRIGRTFPSLIDSLGTNLDHLYRFTLNQVSGDYQPWAKRALSWIIHSFRPLKLNELRIALAFQEETPGKRSGALNLVSDLAATFGPLLRVERDDIHLVHQSFREFIVHPERDDNGPQWYHIDRSETHVEIFRLCLAYLSEDNVLPPAPENNHAFERDVELHALIPFPCETQGLLLYASQYWPKHYQQFAHIPCLLSWHKTVLEFLKKKEAHVWYRINRILEGHATEGDQFSPLIIAAKLGLPNLVAALRETLPSNDPDTQQALELAAACGHIAVVRELLDLCVDSDITQPAVLNDMACKNPSIFAALVTSTTKGHKEVVELLLSKTLSCQIPGMDLLFEQLLSISARTGHLLILQILLKMDIDVNSVYDDLTPLQHASEAGQDHIVEFLLKHPGIDISYGGTVQKTPIYLAVGNGNLVTLGLLLAAGSNVDVEDSKRNPLDLAAAQGHLKVVNLLLTSHPSLPLMPMKKNEPSMNALHWAALKGHPAVTERLLQWDPDWGIWATYQVDHEGNYPHILAAKSGNVKCLELILVHDDFDIIHYTGNKGMTALHHAASNGHAAVVHYLLRNGADLNELSEADENGQQVAALHIAADKGNVNVIAALVEKGAEVNQRTTTGRVALHCAIKYPAAITRLIELRASIDVKDDKGNTPLIHAAEEGEEETVKLLLAAGAKTSLTNYLGLTALHAAARKGSWGCVEALLTESASPFVTAIDHGIPLDAALEGGHTDIARKMIEWITEFDYWEDPFIKLVQTCSSEILISMWLAHRPGDKQTVGSSGCPPIITLAARGSVEIMKKLPFDEADKGLRDSCGRVALDVAFNPAIRALLSPPAPEDQVQTTSDDLNSLILPATMVNYENYFGWIYCDYCYHRFKDEFFYYCHQCHCNNSEPYICIECYKKKRGWKGLDGHDHKVKVWFIHNSMLSIEDLSPWVGKRELPTSGILSMGALEKSHP